jgi:lysyl-tRNA synthetase class 2
MGIDRFVALIADVKSVKDVILFPTMRPETAEPMESDVETKSAKSSTKKKSNR